jgi:hypothetical protein
MGFLSELRLFTILRSWPEASFHVHARIITIDYHVVWLRYRRGTAAIAGMSYTQKISSVRTAEDRFIG